jgi:hypothetical protein
MLYINTQTHTHTHKHTQMSPADFVICVLARLSPFLDQGSPLIASVYDFKEATCKKKGRACPAGVL